MATDAREANNAIASYDRIVLAGGTSTGRRISARGRSKFLKRVLVLEDLSMFHPRVA